jgi:hypothetical protein
LGFPPSPSSIKLFPEFSRSKALSRAVIGSPAPLWLLLLWVIPQLLSIINAISYIFTARTLGGRLVRAENRGRLMTFWVDSLHTYRNRPETEAICLAISREAKRGRASEASPVSRQRGKHSIIGLIASIAVNCESKMTNCLPPPVE